MISRILAFHALLLSTLPLLAEDKPKGLELRVSPSAAQPAPAKPTEAAPAEPLDDAAIKRLLDRLPAASTTPGEKKATALRKGSLPPPRTGKTIRGAFPPPKSAERPAVDAPPALEVVRFSPDGDVPFASHLSVTFSQAMVALDTLDSLAAGKVPVRLEPQPPGTWRWVGTKTLLFEPTPFASGDGKTPKSRFPMASRFRVEVPANTKSRLGGSLKQPVVWNFSTPPAGVVQLSPRGGTPQRRDPVMVLLFDQRIDTAAVLQHLTVECGGKVHAVRAATAEEIGADKTAADLFKLHPKNRMVAFLSPTKFAPGSNVLVRVNAGTPSAEGDRRTTEAQTAEFPTYDSFKVVRHRCGSRNSKKNCPPGSTLLVQFNNRVDAKTFDESMLRIEPELVGMQASVYGTNLHINGRTRGRTKYTITLAANLPDIFDQTLGDEVTLEFEFGPAQPALAAPGSSLTILDPGGPPRFSVFSVNHEKLTVTAYKVAPADWRPYLQYQRDQRRRNTKPVLPGQQVHKETIDVDVKPDEITETAIDLTSALAKGADRILLVVEPTKQPVPEQPQRVVTWLESTKIGLDAFVDQDNLIVWASSLVDGKPLEGVEVRIDELRVSGKTGADGLVTFDLPASKPAAAAQIVATSGDDSAMLPESTSWWSRQSNWWKSVSADSLRWFTFDDRKMYRPGEKVSVKGWVRRWTHGPGGDIGGITNAVTEVKYRVFGGRRNELAKGSAKVTEHGGFDLSFSLPDDVNLGHGRVELSAHTTVALNSTKHTHYYQIQEFRRPEFAVSAQADPGPHLVGGHAEVSVNARYYSGGALGAADVAWNVRATPGEYRPPGWDRFIFGTWQPWWRHSGWHGGPQERSVSSYAGETDDTGTHRIRLDFDAVDPPRPSTVTAEASVTDVNRQNWSSIATMLVHPSALYVGLRSERTFVAKDRPLEVEAIVTDISGAAIPDTIIDLRCFRARWVQRKGEWKEEEELAAEQRLVATKEPVKARFDRLPGGTYRVRAAVVDEQDRRNQCELTLWVAGEKQAKRRDLESQSVKMIPDRKEYRPGSVAKILLQSPFTPAEAVITLRRTGLVETRRVRITEPSYTVEVPIEDTHVPNLFVQVDLVGAAARSDENGVVNERLPKRPAFASGSLRLRVPPHSRTLTVRAKPRQDELEPGQETFVDVLVKAADGRPVSNAEVAVIVVDEAILALSAYQMADPVEFFYGMRSTGVRDYRLRKYVRLRAFEERLASTVPTNALQRNRVLTESSIGLGGGAAGLKAGRDLRLGAPAPGASFAMADGAEVDFSEDGGGGGGDGSPIALRSSFGALALFAPALPTDVEGYARVKVRLPDSLTRYRVMTVAVAGDRQFGKGESSITARLSLMARPSAPRFLNFGDRFELPVVLQNQTAAPMKVAVAVRASNAELTGGAGRSVTVPANDRVEVRFPCVTARAGTARFQIAAAAGKYTDAADVKVPVWTPATTEAFATYGVIASDGKPKSGKLMAIVQPIAKPEGVIADFGGLDISTSSTALHALTDAVIYLTEYPYGCAEQIASRVITVAALRDVLAAFKADGLPPPAELVAAVRRDIKKLHGLQHRSGGFGFWQRSGRTWPYLSVHVAHAIVRAGQKDFQVPDDMLNRSRAYLGSIEKHIPKSYPLAVRRSIIAYALHVLDQMELSDADRTKNRNKARALVVSAGVNKLPLEASGWLLTVIAGDPGSAKQREAILRNMGRRASETAATAQFTTRYEDGAHLLLHSARRTDAILLNALISAQPKSDLIPKVVRGLLGHRKQGRWRNTQENAFVLLALDRYFRVYEKEDPYFVARAWLGDRFAGQHGFEGRTTDRHQISIPMQHLVNADGAQDLIVSKEGRGRLYYRLGLKYAPANLTLDAADHGFEVERAYEAVDDPADVRRDENGVWHVKLGTRVRVKLSMVAPARRYHVALVDKLPAGLEALNPSLAVTGQVPSNDAGPGPGGRGRPSYWWWSRTWYEHQNLRDERAEAFTSLLRAGVHDYSYVTRATTPGSFVVPSAKAEEMYHPETFGRSRSDRVVVE